MRTLFQIIQQEFQKENDLVLASIVASSGSTPRGAGSRMLVGKKGRVAGTIGGGSVEYRAELMALDILEKKESCEHEFRLNRKDVENIGMICGGDVTVFFQYLDHNDPIIMELAVTAETLYKERKDFWLICDLHATSVYVFGGGHVSQKLVPILASVDFHCIVLDDRPEFTDPALFPDAAETILCDFDHLDQSISITDADYCCVMTRGHAYDTIVQAQLLATPACYIGVIGSLAKRAGVFHRLVEEYGIDERELDRIITPVGLNIKAETPAEIAISITGQMIQVRAERKAAMK